MNNIIIISSYRPDYQLIHLFNKLKSYGFENIIIADDGSGPEYNEIYDLLKSKNAVVIRHFKNLGKGVSIKDSIKYVLKNFPDATGIILADGDGQHTPDDILKVSDSLFENDNAIILGIRNMKSKDVPLRQRNRNRFMSALISMDTGKKLPDGQTGLRGIPHSFIPFAASVPGTRFEYETNFLKEASKRNISFVTINIKTLFPEGNSVYYRPVKDTARLLKSPLLFFTSSISCSVVDILLFTLFSALLDHRTANNIFTATILARIVSGSLNFILNRNLSFSGGRHNRFEALKFLSFHIIQMFLSSILVSLLSGIHIPLMFIKMLVDSALFILNYYVSKKWIFK